MARYFFTGGMMPSENLFAHFQQDLLLRDSWWLSGTHTVIPPTPGSPAWMRIAIR